MCGGRGAECNESPRAVNSFEGEEDLRAPEEIKKLVAWWISSAPASVPAVNAPSSTSHSRHDERSPPGRSDHAVTWSSQNSATFSPVGDPSEMTTVSYTHLTLPTKA